ncbi:hypothetical protein imdm_1005 [gamma proteobacterium IMCC2047]|nr:hypothetical protein imdm_1005 [gamma proteobacterium IMCC2047]
MAVMSLKSKGDWTKGGEKCAKAQELSTLHGWLFVENSSN